MVKFNRRELGKFVQDNRLPRYILYGIIILKCTTIYDKMKQIVAINNIYGQIIRDEKESMRFYFKDEGMVQDLIARSILEASKFNDDENDLELRGKEAFPYKNKQSIM